MTSKSTRPLSVELFLAPTGSIVPVSKHVRRHRTTCRVWDRREKALPRTLARTYGAELFRLARSTWAYGSTRA